MLTVPGFAVVLHMFLHLSVNLFCLNAQAQRGLVGNTGNHRDPVVTHLIEIGEVRTGDGTNEYDFVGLSTDAGLVGDGITDLHILQLGEIGVAATIVAE